VLGVVTHHALHFVFRAQHHAHALVQLGGLDVHDAFGARSPTAHREAETAKAHRG